MIRITDSKTECCGCTACANACPRGAIDMKPDAEGFLYPQIIEEKCISCGRCGTICPIRASKEQEHQVLGYIVRHNNPEILIQSTSGGVFTALAAEILREGGSVYGAGYDENMGVVCKKANSFEDLRQMRGSKFVQSALGNVFQEIKRELESERKILFSGTPCQVEGLLAFLRNKPDNLICVDFVCRGVPSPKLWQDYIRVMQDKYHSKIVDARFKNKTYGYHAATMKVVFENGKTYYGSGRVDPMMKAFVSELASRPSCGACAFKTVSRRSDITMFDCYGFSQIMNLPDDNKGYSSLLVQSERGARLFETVQKDFQVYAVEIEKLIETNGIMIKNSALPNPERERFYQLVDACSIDGAIRQISPITVFDRLIESCKFFLYHVGVIQLVKRVRDRIKNKAI